MKTKYILILLCCLLLPYKAYASKIISVRELIEEKSGQEGHEVTVKGEAIGDIMGDEETFWVNIKDGDFFIGIVLNRELKDKIKNLGRYRIKGDIIEVTGTYSIQCPQHYGDRDIHAETLEVIEEGMRLGETVETDKIILCFILSFATIIFISYFHRRIPRKDNVGRQN